MFEKEGKITCKRKELINSILYCRHIRKLKELGKIHEWWEVAGNKVGRADL